MRYILFLALFYFSHFVNAQKVDFSVLSIPNNLKENANSVIRNQQIDIVIDSKRSITFKTRKIVTVFNSKGINNIDAREYYSKSERIVSIEATIYNSYGVEIKKIRRKDFKDQSVADGFSLLTDKRFLALDYTPTEYPFTIDYECETETYNSAGIATWYPIDDYLESVQKSEITIHYPSNLGFKYKEFNLKETTISKSDKPNTITYTAENLIAEKPEEGAPSLSKIFPKVKFALDNFYYEGYEGTCKSWEEYGAWMYNSMLKDTEEITEETKAKLKTLVGNETDPIKKAKIIYKYVQDKTRYVSVQLGIGGWKPMLAKDVDRLGYGDCKALSNYTRVLLKNVGVDSYYTEIYGDRSITDFDKDFVSIEGNHIVLALPNNDKFIFLECTSQSTPFGYQGTFTDDRYALLIKPDKGEIVKTNGYAEKESSQISNGSFSIDENGDLNAKVSIKTRGIQYERRYNLESESKEHIDEHYKDYFSWINNLKLDKIKFCNDKDTVDFTEDISFSASGYGSFSGTAMMFPLNVFNQNYAIPQRYRNRKHSFEVSRGYYDQDTVEVAIPNGFVIDAKPDTVEILEKFGTYKMEVSEVSSNKLIYKRFLIINKGLYDKSEYENYRLFREKIARADNSKIVIIKK